MSDPRRTPVYDDPTRRALTGMVRDFGADTLVSDGRLTYALLSDLSPSTRRENRALREVVDSGIARTLAGLADPTHRDVLLVQYADRLADRSGLDLSLCDRAVAAWLVSLHGADWEPASRTKPQPDPDPDPDDSLPPLPQANWPLVRTVLGIPSGWLISVVLLSVAGAVALGRIRPDSAIAIVPLLVVPPLAWIEAGWWPKRQRSRVPGVPQPRLRNIAWGPMALVEYGLRRRSHPGLKAVRIGWIAVVSAVALAAALLIPANRPADPTISFSGQLELRTGNIARSTIGAISVCAGTGGFTDLTRDATVDLLDDTGRKLAAGHLAVGLPVESGCIFHFDFRNVPQMETYSLAIGKRQPIIVTRSDINAGGGQLGLVISDPFLSPVLGPATGNRATGTPGESGGNVNDKTMVTATAVPEPMGDSAGDFLTKVQDIPLNELSAKRSDVAAMQRWGTGTAFTLAEPDSRQIWMTDLRLPVSGRPEFELTASGMTGPGQLVVVVREVGTEVAWAYAIDLAVMKWSLYRERADVPGDWFIWITPRSIPDGLMVAGDPLRMRVRIDGTSLKLEINGTGLDAGVQIPEVNGVIKFGYGAFGDSGQADANVTPFSATLVRAVVTWVSPN